MRWPWSKKPTRPEIPPYAPVIKPAAPKEPDIIVEEVDTSQMTQTGIFKAWRRMTGKGD